MIPNQHHRYNRIIAVMILLVSFVLGPQSALAVTYASVSKDEKSTQEIGSISKNLKRINQASAAHPTPDIQAKQSGQKIMDGMYAYPVQGGYLVYVYPDHKESQPAESKAKVSWLRGASAYPVTIN